MRTLKEEAERIDILAGLLQLRRDGQFFAIWCNELNMLRVQYQVDGPIKVLGWRQAKDMVTTAREAAATALAAELEASRKPPASERSQRAVASSSGKTR